MPGASIDRGNIHPLKCLSRQPKLFNSALLSKNNQSLEKEIIKDNTQTNKQRLPDCVQSAVVQTSSTGKCKTNHYSVGMLAVIAHYVKQSPFSFSTIECRTAKKIIIVHHICYANPAGDRQTLVLSTLLTLKLVPFVNN